MLQGRSAKRALLIQRPLARQEIWSMLLSGWRVSLNIPLIDCK